MADRTLVSYEEPRAPEGPYWRLRIERSAAGAPGGMVTIEHKAFEGTPLPDQEMTVVLEDLRVLQPAVDWAVRGQAVAAFKEAWEAADARGEVGRRTEAGIDAVLGLLRP